LNWEAVERTPVSPNREGTSEFEQALDLTRVRLQLTELRDHLGAAAKEEPGLGSRIDALEIALCAVEALAIRAESADDDVLRRVATLKRRELGREAAALTMAALGYYALPAYDPLRMSNEGPVGPDLGRDAMAELFGYVGDLDDMTERDRIAALTMLTTDT
jgi:hypothetical protein